jgi:hypothetical protein
MKFAIGEFLRELVEPLQFSLKSENFIIPFAWGLTCISVHISTLSLFAIVETKTLKCVVYSEIHFVFWTTPHVLKYILCSEVHLMFWNTFCVLNYTLCSEINVVFWITPYVLKYTVYSKVTFVFSKTLYSYTSFMSWNKIYVLKYIYIL